MPLRSYIGEGYKAAIFNLPLNREAVLICIGEPISVPESGRTRNGEKLRPVDRIIRIFYRCGRRGELRREALALIKSGAPIYKGRSEDGRSGTGPEKAKRSVAFGIKPGGVLKGFVVDTETGANAGLSGSA